MPSAVANRLALERRLCGFVLSSPGAAAGRTAAAAGHSD
jgi:hypothetical protein